MTGRPSKFTHELFDEICERISKGETLASICRDKNLGASTVYDWMTADKDLFGQFARAREAGFDAIALEALEIVDSTPPSVRGAKDGAHVQWQKLRAETRLKLLAKWDPKRYGERVDMTSSDGSMTPKGGEVDFSKVSDAALAELMAARRPSD